MLSSRQRVVRRLRDLLRVSLLGGLFGTPGQGKLPTEAELMAQFHAPRDVVREALAALQDEGLVERRQGAGTLVLGVAMQAHASLPAAGGSLEDHLRLGRISAEVLDWLMVPAPPVMAERIDGVAVGDLCLCVDYLLQLDGRPIAAITNYVRAPEHEALRREAFTTDYYAMLAACGVPVTKHTTTIEAAPAEPRVAELLGIKPGDPVKWSEQVLHNDRGERFNFATVAFHREFRTTLTGTPRAEPG